MKYYTVKLTKDELISILTVIDIYLFNNETNNLPKMELEKDLEKIYNSLMIGEKNGRIKKYN